MRTARWWRSRGRTWSCNFITKNTFVFPSLFIFWFPYAREDGILGLGCAALFLYYLYLGRAAYRCWAQLILISFFSNGSSHRA